MCPFCGSRSWVNSWNTGNAQCTACEQEFVVTTVNGQLTGLPVPAEDQRRNLPKPRSDADVAEQLPPAQLPLPVKVVPVLQLPLAHVPLDWKPSWN